MSSSVPQISIPTWSTASHPKPHTVYNIMIRLPLRTSTLSKRYSDFVKLNSDLESIVGHAPPCSLPPKSFMSSTVTNHQLAEDRRVGLEKYLHTIASSDDQRWRNAPAWRQFLNLPSSATGQQAAAAGSHLASTSSMSSPVTDPVQWLDMHRELKSKLQDARFQLSVRETSNATQEQLDASAAAKKSLVRAAGLIDVLDTGLKAFTSSGSVGSIGEGELRRRRDLVAAARKEKDALEALASNMAGKKSQEALMNPSTKSGAGSLWGNQRSQSPFGREGRVLGQPLPETSKTRELDNQGVLQMQQEVMQSQDRDLETLLVSARRQKQLGLEIGEVLDEQNNWLNALDADVGRVEGKMQVAKKRMKKIS